MGMFDYIRCEVELPNGKRNVLDQTKEFDCVLLHHKIDSLGQLWLDRSDTIDDESSQKLTRNNDFTGSIEIDDYDLCFYRGELDGFESKVDGRLTRFRKPTYEDLHVEVDRLRSVLEGYDELRKNMKGEISFARDGETLEIRHPLKLNGPVYLVSSPDYAVWSKSLYDYIKESDCE
jgi:hypothetical protein